MATQTVYIHVHVAKNMESLPGKRNLSGGNITLPTTFAAKMYHRSKALISTFRTALKYTLPNIVLAY